jgi:hypothetical protein
MVSPFAARLTLHDVSHSGTTVGRLYALSTLGSISGTFAAGFWLIPCAGSAALLLVLAAVLLASALACSFAHPAAKAAAALVLILAAGFPSPPFAPDKATVLRDEDTAFQRLLIYDMTLDHKRNQQ